MGVNEAATPSGGPAEPFPELWEAAALDRYGSLFAEGPFAVVDSAPESDAEPDPEPGSPGPGAVSVAGASEVVGAEAPVPEKAPEAPLVTGTLGRLLEDQGHVDEAAQVYGDVLAARPTDDEVRQRALEAARRQEWPLAAEDLVPTAERAGMEPVGARRELLGRYLERLGRGGD